MEAIWTMSWRRFQVLFSGLSEKSRIVGLMSAPKLLEGEAAEKAFARM